MVLRTHHIALALALFLALLSWNSSTQFRPRQTPPVSAVGQPSKVAGRAANTAATTTADDVAVAANTAAHSNVSLASFVSECRAAKHDGFWGLPQDAVFGLRHGVHSSSTGGGMRIEAVEAVENGLRRKAQRPVSENKYWLHNGFSILPAPVCFDFHRTSSSPGGPGGDELVSIWALDPRVLEARHGQRERRPDSGFVRGKGEDVDKYLAELRRMGSGAKFIVFPHKFTDITITVNRVGDAHVFDELLADATTQSERRPITALAIPFKNPSIYHMVDESMGFAVDFMHQFADAQLRPGFREGRRSDLKDASVDFLGIQLRQRQAGERDHKSSHGAGLRLLFDALLAPHLAEETQRVHMSTSFVTPLPQGPHEKNRCEDGCRVVRSCYCGAAFMRMSRAAERYKRVLPLQRQLLLAAAARQLHAGSKRDGTSGYVPLEELPVDDIGALCNTQNLSLVDDERKRRRDAGEALWRRLNSARQTSGPLPLLLFVLRASSRLIGSPRAMRDALVRAGFDVAVVIFEDESSSAQCSHCPPRDTTGAPFDTPASAGAQSVSDVAMQIALVRHADVLVAVHGAALSWMLAMDSSSVASPIPQRCTRPVLGCRFVVELGHWGAKLKGVHNAYKALAHDCGLGFQHVRPASVRFFSHISPVELAAARAGNQTLAAKLTNTVRQEQARHEAVSRELMKARFPHQFPEFHEQAVWFNLPSFERMMAQVKHAMTHGACAAG